MQNGLINFCINNSNSCDLDLKYTRRIYRDKNIYTGFRVLKGETEGENFKVDMDTNQVIIQGKIRKFDTIFGNQIKNNKLWSKAKEVMELEENECCIFMTNGLSGSGKTYSFVGPANDDENIGLVLASLRDIYHPDMKVRIGEFLLETDLPRITELPKKSSSNHGINCWTLLTERSGSLDDLERFLFDAMKSRKTLFTKNNDTYIFFTP